MKRALVLSGLAAGVVLTACVTQSAITNTSDRTPVTPVQAGDDYYTSAEARVKARAAVRQPGHAKNVILFIGDGMGISTITAGRIYAGQKQGVDGESYQLAMEKMPNVALSKTYQHDGQISDSASTAVSIVSGVKTNVLTIGYDRKGHFGNCGASQGHEVRTLFELAEDAGLSTGIVSTARITHATPASTFAKSASRDWEVDGDLEGQPEGCKDIAAQLIDWPAGDGFEVAMGGGRRFFMTRDQADPEYEGKTGSRGDGRDLIADWSAKSDDHVYVWDKASFDAIDFSGPSKVLGLFEPSHMQFELDRAGDGAGEPSLAELTTAAITRLAQNDEGYVLMVEGGRVDHGHHAGNAKRALEDVVSLDAAIKAAVEMAGDDTLIMVTADHSHTLAIAGYAARGNPILGKSSSGVGALARGGDGIPYTTLGYLNGPGAVCKMEDGKSICERPDITDVDTEADNYMQQALIPMSSETHGGEDVAIFATGPGSEVVSGVMEENESFHVMGLALGLIE